MARIVIEPPGGDEAGFLEFLLEVTQHQETIRAVQAGTGYTRRDLEELVVFLASHMDGVDLEEAKAIVRGASSNELGEMMAGLAGEDDEAPFDGEDGDRQPASG